MMAIIHHRWGNDFHSYLISFFARGFRRHLLPLFPVRNSLKAVPGKKDGGWKHKVTFHVILEGELRPRSEGISNSRWHLRSAAFAELSSRKFDGALPFSVQSGRRDTGESEAENAMAVSLKRSCHVTESGLKYREHLKLRWQDGG